jgi:hypothetical protein
MWTPSDPLPTPSEPGGSADSRSARDQRKQLRLQLIQLRDARRDVAQLVGQRVDADEDLEPIRWLRYNSRRHPRATAGNPE